MPPPYSLIVYSVTLDGTHARVSLFPGTPGLESRNCPETVPGGVSGLWELITPDYNVWLQRGLNQTCSPRRDLFNDVSHSRFGGQEEVDSRLLVVGSQIASLTPGPSFAHNLGCRCPNEQCEAIFDIYASRPFQWHQEHINARFFGPCCRALNIRESRRTPNPQLWKCWASPPHLAKVGLRQETWATSLLKLPRILYHGAKGLVAHNTHYLSNIFVVKVLQGCLCCLCLEFATAPLYTCVKFWLVRFLDLQFRECTQQLIA
jgi:hypothetical protein